MLIASVQNHIVFHIWLFTASLRASTTVHRFLTSYFSRQFISFALVATTNRLQSFLCIFTSTLHNPRDNSSRPLFPRTSARLTSHWLNSNNDYMSAESRPYHDILYLNCSCRPCSHSAKIASSSYISLPQCWPRSYIDPAATTKLFIYILTQILRQNLQTCHALIYILTEQPCYMVFPAADPYCRYSRPWWNMYTFV